MTTILANIGRTVFQLGYELSPIILTNGIATAIPGNMLPVIAITQAANFTLGLLNGTDPIDPNDFFAHFYVPAGGTLIDFDLGRYPFANQAIAANATIAQPLVISLVMDCPVNQTGGYISKLTTMTALQAALLSHGQLGGTYIVATPAKIYTNAILRNLRDITNASKSQMQSRWQWDFEIPLISVQDATNAYNALMGKIAGGLPTQSTVWSSLANSIGVAPGGAPALVQGSNNLVGSAIGNIAQTGAQVGP